MSFTPRKPLYKQQKTSPAKPCFILAGTPENETIKRYDFQTCDKAAGGYSVPELKDQLGINSGEWTNIQERVSSLL